MARLAPFRLPRLGAHDCSFLNGNSGAVGFPRSPRPASSRWSSTSRFTGVYWCPRKKKFHVSVSVAGSSHYCGVFACQEEAALAYDTKLRQLCNDRHRLHKSLNFPSLKESLFLESPAEARARHMRMAAARSRESECKALDDLIAEFQKSTARSAFEIVPLGLHSRADAICRQKNSPAGLPLQLKAASSHGGGGRGYNFGRVLGYSGMLVLLSALDRDIMWAVSGSDLDRRGKDTLYVSFGSQRDCAWRVGDLASTLQQCFYNSNDYPHVALADARLECSPRHCVEELAHRQSQAALQQAGLRLKPCMQASAVDSMLIGYGMNFAVQEKASHKRKTRGDYLVSLSRHGGVLGRLPYLSTDFELLMISLLDEQNRLEGLYLMPTSTLAEHGLVDERPVVLSIYPPWLPPKRKQTMQKHAWQLNHFVDLRGWTGGPLSGDTVGRLLQLLLHPGLDSKP